MIDVERKGDGNTNIIDADLTWTNMRKRSDFPVRLCRMVYCVLYLRIVMARHQILKQNKYFFPNSWGAELTVDQLLNN